MDTRDVSDRHEFADFMKRIQNAAEKASRRKGQMVREHPPKEKLITEFTMRLFKTSLREAKDEEKTTICTTQVPAPYPPCIVSAEHLEAMMISDMRLETHHRGHKVTLRVLTPPDRLNAVLAIAEDEQGIAVLLQLYQQPEEALVPNTEILAPGKVCIVKEPFFKATTDSTYSVRVDHLGDIIWLDEGDERIPSPWKKPKAILSGSSTGIRMQGNDAVKSEDWAVAERL